MVQRRFEFYDRRYLRFFKIASVIALAVAGLGSFLFEIGSGIGRRSMDIFLHSGILSDIGYIAGGMGCIWFLYIAAMRLGLIPALSPCVVLTGEGLFVKNQFHVPWKAIVTVREYRMSYVEFDEMWLLLEVDDTSFHIAPEAKSDVAAFYKTLVKKTLAESIDKSLVSKNLLPINCQKIGIRSDKLLSCIGSYLPKQIVQTSLKSVSL